MFLCARCQSVNCAVPLSQAHTLPPSAHESPRSPPSRSFPLTLSLFFVSACLPVCLSVFVTGAWYPVGQGRLRGSSVLALRLLLFRLSAVRGDESVCCSGFSDARGELEIQMCSLACFIVILTFSVCGAPGVDRGSINSSGPVASWCRSTCALPISSAESKY